MGWIDKRIMPKVTMKTNRAPKVSASYKQHKPNRKDDDRHVIIAQAKMLRLMQMIVLLQSSAFTIAQLAKRFDMCERSVYRYIKIMEALDFLVDKDFDNRYFIQKTNRCPLCGGELHHA